MSRTSRLLAVSLAVFAAGLFLTAQSVLTWPSAARQLRGRIATLEQLRALEGGLGRDDEAVAMFDKLPVKRPAALDDLAARCFPGVQSSIRQRESRPAAAGWTVRSMDVALEGARLADLSRFLEEALAGGEFGITTSAQGNPGTGRVSLTLEALEKTSLEK
jgi:hypothetical protein